MDEYRREQRSDSRFDASLKLAEKVKNALIKVARELEQKLAKYKLNELVRKVAKLTKVNSLNEWKRVYPKRYAWIHAENYPGWVSRGQNDNGHSKRNSEGIQCYPQKGPTPC